MTTMKLPLKQKRVSFIGDPISDSVLYVGKKVEDKLDNLQKVSGCLIFVENGVGVSESLQEKHQFVFTDNPTLAYTEYTRRIADELDKSERGMKYALTDGGYYLGEDVLLGTNVYIEPGALIGHQVSIGDNSTVLAGAVIKNAIIGKDCLIKEYALIGGQAFMMATDNEKKVYRIPCLGDVVLEDHVEVGSFTTVCRGSNTSTKLCEYVKLDDHVHVGHDVVLEKRVFLTAGSVLGGYVYLGEDVYVGLNAAIKQMVKVEAGSFISMGARVGRDVQATSGVFGVPKTDAGDK